MSRKKYILNGVNFYSNKKKSSLANIPSVKLANTSTWLLRCVVLGGRRWFLAVVSSITRIRVTDFPLLTLFQRAVLTKQLVQSLHIRVGSCHLMLSSISPLFRCCFFIIVLSGARRIHSPALSHPVCVLLPVRVVGLCHMLVPFQLWVVPRSTWSLSTVTQSRLWYFQPAVPKQRFSMLSYRTKNKQLGFKMVALTSYYWLTGLTDSCDLWNLAYDQSQHPDEGVVSGCTYFILWYLFAFYSVWNVWLQLFHILWFLNVNL